MATLAAVMTGQSTSAIATIQMVGDGAETIVGHIFRPFHSKPLKPGVVVIGTLRDEDKSIDQVALGCEAQQVWSLHCHGNPLITEAVMALLRKHGATLVSPRQLYASFLNAHQSLTTPAVEVKFALLNVTTLAGATLLSRQASAGLTQWAQQWLKGSSISIADIVNECREILERSVPAKYMLYGCTLVLAGPPNVGKSTLLNSLTGQNSAIVTNIKGTTRDWVKATLRTDRLCMHVIDTAGLDTISGNHNADHPDKASQERTRDILDSADLILFVLDQSQPANQFESAWLNLLHNKRTIIVLNKIDLAGRLKISDLPVSAKDAISISAKNEKSLDSLIAHIETTLGINTIHPEKPVCFTDRQTHLLQSLVNCADKQQARYLLNELLHGNLHHEK